MRGVRYIDTGSRQARNALGSWFSETVVSDPTVVSVRIQTGFFAQGPLTYFIGALDRLRVDNALTRFVIGSNDGETSRASLESLLSIVGPPRSRLSLGVVAYTNAFFHPKVYHFERQDGSCAAYVGSANLTDAGVASRHVEAGVILDTRDGDRSEILDSIAQGVDGWFAESRPGFFPFQSSMDLGALAKAQLIDIAAEPLLRPQHPATGQHVHLAGLAPAVLRPLVQAPAGPPLPVPASAPEVHSLPEDDSNRSGIMKDKGSVTILHWSKILSASDAQRKGIGNQRGAVTLVQGEYRGKLNQRTFFRFDLFASAQWRAAESNKGPNREEAVIVMTTVVGDTGLGDLEYQVSYEPSRESSQGNYTSTLHIQPLAALFRANDMTGRRLEIELDATGRYKLLIS